MAWVGFGFSPLGGRQEERRWFSDRSSTQPATGPFGFEKPGA
jgi:hypothetical protein